MNNVETNYIKPEEITPVVTEPADVSEDIKTLEKLNQLATKDEIPAVTVSKVDSPVGAMVKKLENYMDNGFKALSSDLVFNEEMKAELRNRFANLDDKAFLNLFANWNTVLNDRISKMTAPEMSLMTELNKAEIAEQHKREMAEERRANAQQNNITINTGGQASSEKLRNLNEDAEPAVINGLNSLYSLLGAFAEIKNKQENQ
jgi:hypothetical protein